MRVGVRPRLRGCADQGGPRRAGDTDRPDSGALKRRCKIDQPPGGLGSPPTGRQGRRLL